MNPRDRLLLLRVVDELGNVLQAAIGLATAGYFFVQNYRHA